MTSATNSAVNLPHPKSWEWFCTVLLALGLTFVFWNELWCGGGIIGGDLYSYYFPQKCYLVERWRVGEFPLWNPLVGHGYPLVGEGQTAPFYPLHVLCYGGAALDWWSVNTAYNIDQLLHYGLAYLFTCMYLRCIGLRQSAACLSGLVFAYGWFPARLCWEWAIITGAWFPLVFWCAERYLRTEYWRYLIWLSVVLGVQMLAGHFNLAFMTQVSLSAYIPLRLWWRNADLPEGIRSYGFRHSRKLAVAIALGFGLAAIQLAPTWELKQSSQRTGAHREFDPNYGFIPIWYWKTWARLVSPWMWSQHEQHLREAPQILTSSTNKVEAHLYFGTATVLLLVVVGLVCWRRRAPVADAASVSNVDPGSDSPSLATSADAGSVRHGVDAGRVRCVTVIWFLFGLIALVLSSGLLFSMTKHIPGFAFFAGPGRWGLVTTWAVAVLAAAGWQTLTRNWTRSTRGLLFVVLFAVTVIDLRWVGRESGYVSFTATPALSFANVSPIKKVLAETAPNLESVRLFCRGPNLVTILGVSSTPTYIGLSPAEYFDAATRMPGEFPFDVAPTAAQLDWLRRAGVTHVLSFSPLDPRDWPDTRLIWEGWDRFLNLAWGRREPFYLYAFNGGRGRVAWKKPDPSRTARTTDYRANQISLQTTSDHEDTLILTDLFSPGWRVTIDGRRAESQVIDGMYRGVTVPPGQHTINWTYVPKSVLVGAIISIFSVLILLALGHVRFWHRQWFGDAF